MGDDNYPRFVIMVMGGSGGLCLVMRESEKKNSEVRVLNGHLCCYEVTQNYGRIWNTQQLLCYLQ